MNYLIKSFIAGVFAIVLILGGCSADTTGVEPALDDKNYGPTLHQYTDEEDARDLAELYENRDFYEYQKEILRDE